ncbi:MAG: 6-phosphogluconolactonase [Gammaproteobacteria bacterium]
MAVCEHFFPDHASLLDMLVSRIERCLERGISENDKATFMISGGSTPKPLFELLSKSEIAWRHVSCALVDERWVAEDHEASNTALVREHLLRDKARHARFQRTWVDDKTVEERVAQLNERGFWRDLEPTVTILGMGSDLHTASIFPDADHTVTALAPTAPTLLHTYPTGTPTNPPFDRVTLSRNAIARSSELILLLRGDEKRERYEYAKTLTPDNASSAPIVALLSDPDLRVEVYGSP